MRLHGTLVVIVALTAPGLLEGAWADPPSGTRGASGEVEWQPVADSAHAEAGPAYLSVLDVIGKLTIAVLVAYGVSLAARWAQQRFRPAWAQKRRPEAAETMRLEEVLPLGTDAKLYIVLVEGHRILLGSQGGNLRHLADLAPTPPMGLRQGYGGQDGPQVGPSASRSTSRRPGGERDELNIVHAPSSRLRRAGAPASRSRLRQGYAGQAGRQGAVRSDVVSDEGAWERRRDELLRELQES